MLNSLINLYSAQYELQLVHTSDVLFRPGYVGAAHPYFQWQLAIL